MIADRRTQILQIKEARMKKKSLTAKKFIYPRVSENDLSSNSFFHSILPSILQDAVSRLISLGTTRLGVLSICPVF